MVNSLIAALKEHKKPDIKDAAVRAAVRFAFSLVKKKLGARAAEEISTRIYRLAADAACYHHENYDGSGYPERLRGEEIPLIARIVRVADCIDAATSDRRYKKGIGLEEALHGIINGDRYTQPSHFDPLILEALKDPEVKHLFKRVKKKYSTRRVKRNS